MLISDLLLTVWGNLNRMRGRVVLTAFGVVIGTAAVVVLVSLGAGLQRNAMGSIGSVANLRQINVMPRWFESGSGPKAVISSAGPSEAPRGDEPQGLTEAALEELRAIPGLVAVIPIDDLQVPAQLRLDRAVAGGQITGATAGMFEALELQAREGELTIGRGQMVVGARISQSFYDPVRGAPVVGEPLLGATVTLEVMRYGADSVTTRTWRYRIAGILAESGENDYQIFVPAADARAMNEWGSGRRIDRNREGYNRAVAVAENSRSVSEIQKTIREMGYEAYSMQDVLEQVNSFFGVLQAVLGAIGGIALLVAAFGIVNTLSMAILERTREIGLIKAVGARNRDVMSIFLSEAALIGFMGGVIGVLVGWGLSGIANLVIMGVLEQTGGGSPFGGSEAPAAIVQMPPWLALFAVAFATGVGLLSGVYPSLRAATLDPLRALKYE